MKDTLIGKIRIIQLDMLRSFIEICKKQNLRYFLIGGSCLGTIRHCGFIPWDDDIDIGMPREDYEKFSKIAKDMLPEYLFFQTNETDPEYPQMFGKIRNSNTTYIETSVKHLKINHGVYIDIFPLDGISNNKLQHYFDRIVMSFFNISISRCFVPQISTRSNLLKKFIKQLIWILTPDVKNIIKIRNRYSCKYPYSSSKSIANHGGAWGTKEIMPKAVFGNGRCAVFEDIEIVIPEEYDEYLTRLYGDYMILPPVEKQIGHHYYDIVDTNKSYLEYFKERKN